MGAAFVDCNLEEALCARAVPHFSLRRADGAESRGLPALHVLRRGGRRRQGATDFGRPLSEGDVYATAGELRAALLSLSNKAFAKEVGCERSFHSPRIRFTSYSPSCSSSRNSASSFSFENVLSALRPSLRTLQPTKQRWHRTM